MSGSRDSSIAGQDASSRATVLIQEILRQEPQAAANRLADESAQTIAVVLTLLPTAKALALLPRFGAAQRAAILKAVTPEQREQWLHNQRYPKGSVGRLMEPAVALFSPALTVRDAVARLRGIVREAFISYGYVVDEQQHLIGALVMRELLLAEPDQSVREIMVERPFSLQAVQQVAEIIPLVHTRHFPEYPVCDDEGRIIGIVRGYALFEEQTLELSAQPGKIMGIDREERILTGAWRSLHLRNPWLQVNLLSSFLAAGVMGFFETTLVQVVAVAAFVPVMVGQSASTGGQALAVSLRALTLGEFKPEHWRALINKEAFVGVANGALVGVIAALGIYAYAAFHGHAGAGRLALVMLLAMIVSTLVSGVVGAATPILMKRLGYDPAAASTVLVGGVTRIISIAAFLILAQSLFF